MQFWSTHEEALIAAQDIQESNECLSKFTIAVDNVSSTSEPKYSFVFNGKFMNIAPCLEGFEAFALGGFSSNIDEDFEVSRSVMPRLGIVGNDIPHLFNKIQDYINSLKRDILVFTDELGLH